MVFLELVVAIYPCGDCGFFPRDGLEGSSVLLGFFLAELCQVWKKVHARCCWFLASDGYLVNQRIKSILGKSETTNAPRGKEGKASCR